MDLEDPLMNIPDLSGYFSTPSLLWAAEINDAVRFLDILILHRMRDNLNSTRIGHNCFDHRIVQDKPNIIRDLISFPSKNLTGLMMSYSFNITVTG